MPAHGWHSHYPAQPKFPWDLRQLLLEPAASLKDPPFEAIVEIFLLVSWP
jgi:hypothetical protein